MRNLIPMVVAAMLAACAGDDPLSPLVSMPSTDTPAFARAPATGNGNKLVDAFDRDFGSVDCGGGKILDVHIKGWVQTRFFPAGNRNVQLDVFHSILTFTNLAGETFIFHDLGPDRVYFADGNLVVALTGRIGSEGHIGRLVINAETGEVEFIAGNDIGDVFGLACAALT
jgi:hypothetical protein